MPSWAPDWSEDRPLFRLSCAQAYRASGLAALFLEMDTAAAGRIILSGIRVDRISYVSEEIIQSIYDPRYPEKCGRFVNENLARIPGSQKYRGLDAVEVLWRTLTADVFAVWPPGAGPGAAARAGLGRLLHAMNIVNKQERTVVPGVEELGDWKGQD